MGDFGGLWFNLARGVLGLLGVVWLGTGLWLLVQSGSFPEEPTFGRMIAIVGFGGLLAAGVHLLAAALARTGSGWGRATGLSVAVLGVTFSLVLFFGGLVTPLPAWLAVLGLLGLLTYGFVLAALGIAGSERYGPGGLAGW